MHIGRIKDTPIDDKTIVDKHIAQELSSEKCIVRFHLSHQHTTATRATTVVMVSPTATSQGSSHHEYAYEIYPPPASVCHCLLSLRLSPLILFTLTCPPPPLRP